MRFRPLVAALALGLPACTPTRPPGPPVPPPGPVVPPTAAGMFAALNHYRAAAGIGVLADDPRLDRSAQAQADDCARRGQLTHTGSDGSSPWDRMTRQGVKYHSASENAAAWQRSSEEAVGDWANESPDIGHRANVYNRAWTHCGSGVARAQDGRYYYVQDYAQE